MPGLRLVRQGNTGVYGARNRGITEAQCELVAFLDGDDTWEPSFLKTITELHQKYPSCGIYGTSWQKIMASGETIIPRFCNVPAKEQDGILENYFIAASKGAVLSSSSVAIPKHIFEAVGIFTVEAGVGGDKEMWVRIATDYPIAFSHKILATWHLDASNRIGKTCRYRLEPPCVPAGKRILKRKDLSEEIRRWLSIYLRTQIVFNATKFIRSGGAKQGRKMLLKAGIPSSCPVKWLVYMFVSYLPSSLIPPLYNLACQARRHLLKIGQRGICNNHFEVRLDKDPEPVERYWTI